MVMDLTSLPSLLLESVLSKMDHLSFSRTRQTCKELLDFVDRRRRQIPVTRSVFALQFLPENKALIRPTFGEEAFLVGNETAPVEFAFLRPDVVSFHSLDFSDVKERLEWVNTRGVGVIVDGLNEAAVIYLSSILCPRILYAQGVEFSQDILHHPGMRDLVAIHINSSQGTIDLSPCGPNTKEIVIDMREADCPETDIIRLLKMWERGIGSLSRMELQFNDEFHSRELCDEIVHFCLATPIFTFEDHERLPLKDVDIKQFKNSRFDRLVAVSNTTASPQAAVVLFQRGKFIFEATSSRDEFYDALNKYGNMIFVDTFRQNFRNVISVYRHGYRE